MSLPKRLEPLFMKCNLFSYTANYFRCSVLKYIHEIRRACGLAYSSDIRLDTSSHISRHCRGKHIRTRTGAKQPSINFFKLFSERNQGSEHIIS